ncbi:DNA replication and repair protein RecF [Dysgonomonas sp. HDW5A]|uniref:DNA replication/repair protein RecF n=1 Tax=Dysgonomonas sp. HDW5A TaxID=2714926 RepID=UPI0014092035|nr:DNA replication and repair protein RecF [Dysgonomonas sp. HDW5A]QIK58639.1 DNA replication and repair protein RecF [Dysgonomonas sp. HDW5A]
MILERISILGYKNIEQAELTFSPKLNCFIGKNGMGKTNLLDAVYYLSFCKSHNNQVDSQNIKHDADFALIQGYYLLGGSDEEEFFCSLRRRQKKQFKRNKKEYEKLSDHIGCLPLVMVSPSDSDLITGGSDERRKFMDVVLSQFDKEYLHALIRYNKALQQRNALLKSDMQADESLYELWEEQLAYEGQIIHTKRKAFVEQFIPTFQYYYNFICQSNETVELKYESPLDEGNLVDLLKHKRKRDKILGYTTAGVHRDDLDMRMDDYSIKKVGSQGQNKTYVVAMKLAQFDFLKKAGSTTPILLLDDIFDKLDSTRVEQIVKLVSEDNFGQIFITDTNRDHLDEILKGLNSDYRLYQVEGGGVLQLK